MSNENRTMTAAERAALAEAREAEAQKRKFASQNTAVRRPTQSTQTANQKNSAYNTKEYPKAPAANRPQNRNVPPKKPVQMQPTPVQTEKENTGEFPSYVRSGKGGYHPPKAKKRQVAKHRRKLDPRFKAVLLAVCALLLIIFLLLIFGVRYTTIKLSDNSSVKFFGITKGGNPTSGWISYSNGIKGKLGNGKIEYSDDALYEGAIVNGLPSGVGKMTDAEGNVFEGTFMEGKKNGQFNVTYKNGNTYVGGFVNDEFSGHGVLTVKGQNVYDGLFANNEKNGQGKMTYENGTVYEGNFVNGKKNGQGTMTYNDESKFEGIFKNDFREQGKYTFANKDVFQGTFRMDDDNYMSEGSYTYADTGITQEGKFDSNKNFIPN